MIRYKQQERKRPARVINKKSQSRQEEKKLPKTNTASGFYYSFLTVILLLCLIQITISAVLNVSKIISYNAKIIQITKSRNAAKALNEQLQDNIKNFSNVTGLEAIARNNLKMSGEDEVLVIINANKPEDEAEGKDNIGKLIKLKKHD